MLSSSVACQDVPKYEYKLDMSLLHEQDNNIGSKCKHAQHDI